MRKKIQILSVLFFSILSTQAWAALPSNVSVKCYQDSANGFWWDYCTHVVQGSTNKDVIYYFHGIYGSEYEWQYSAAAPTVYKEWGTNAPEVITITYGSIWLLAEKNGSGRSGLYEHFVNTALPNTEKRLGLTPAHRMLFGLSMGGFNAAQVYFKNPNLFSKVALACPAITSIGPYASQEEINAYEQRTHADASYVNNALYLSAVYFPTQAAWDKAAPITLAQSAGSNLPPLYVSGGTQDQYGFFEGSQQMVDLLASKGVQAHWTPVDGKHCSFDVNSTALFFITP